MKNYMYDSPNRDLWLVVSLVFSIFVAIFFRGGIGYLAVIVLYWVWVYHNGEKKEKEERKLAQQALDEYYKTGNLAYYYKVNMYKFKDLIEIAEDRRKENEIRKKEQKAWEAKEKEYVRKRDEARKKQDLERQKRLEEEWVAKYIKNHPPKTY